MSVHLVFYFIGLILLAAATPTDQSGGSGCNPKCGNVTVPFPFGIEEGCYFNQWFKVTCNKTDEGKKKKKPFISGTNLEIVESYTDTSVLVKSPVTRINCGDQEGLNDSIAVVRGYSRKSPFLISGRYNYIGAIGCGNLVTIVDNKSNIIGGCLQPRCGHMTSNGCYSVLSLIKSYNLLTVSVNISKFYSDEDEGKRCTFIFILPYQFLDLEKGLLPDINNRSTQLTARLKWAKLPDCKSEAAAPCQQPGGPRNKHSNCDDKCGKINISYPFGIKEGCYKDEWYKVICKNNKSTPFISKLDLQILSISFPYGKILVNHSVSYFSCPQNNTTGVSHKLKGSPFFYSQSWNRFKSVGCGKLVTLFHNQTDLVTSCMQPSCGDDVNSNNLTCVMVIPPGINSFIVNMTWDYHGNDGIGRKHPSCGYTFVSVSDYFPLGLDESDYFFSRTSYVDYDYFSSSISYVADDYLSEPMTTYHPALLEWAKPISGQCELKEDIKCTSDKKYCWTNFNSTYLCVCSNYENSVSYSSDVCAESGKCKYPSFKYCYMLCFNEPDKYCYMQNPTSSNEKSRDRGITIGFSTSIGTIFVLVVGWGMYKFQKRRKNKKRRQKYFKRNGGLLLQQQLSTNKGGGVDRIKLFASKELVKATDHYNENRVLGQGGQGTVYKGMLADGSIVAIKKSKMVEEKKKLLDDRKLEQFINEVILLSQINHRNVVKLLGCCLETPIPLLVYEFVPNGTLSQLIEDHNDEFPLTWEMRLRIATDIGNALSYLHSAASVPIYHRDIKSSNILLDDKYRAKVSDFGTSKSIALEQTHLTTKVQGTLGYMDPEYFRSSQYTEKSDVYSFGVVLVELLTGKKPIPSEKSEEVRSLVPSFLLSMKENTLFDILDSRMVNNGAEEEIAAVGKLAKRCLNLIGKKRPTMKQVAMELEMIRNSEANGMQQIDDEDVDSDDTIEASTMDSHSTCLATNNSVTLPQLDEVFPLLCNLSKS